MEEFGGLYFQYLIFCKRRLWMHHKGLSTDDSNINIIIGKINHKNFNKEEFKIGNISIDKIKKGVIYEFKKSDKYIGASIAQLEDYIYILNNKYNISIHKGILQFKKGKDIEIAYDEKLKINYIKNFNNIKKIINAKTIPIIENNISVCKKCGYYEKCYI